MRIRFTADYDHVETMRTLAYRKGMEDTVTKEIGEAAIAAGKAEEVKPEKPAKPDRPVDGE